MFGGCGISEYGMSETEQTAPKLPVENVLSTAKKSKKSKKSKKVQDSTPALKISVPELKNSDSAAQKVKKKKSRKHGNQMWDKCL